MADISQYLIAHLSEPKDNKVLASPVSLQLKCPLMVENLTLISKGGRMEKKRTCVSLQYLIIGKLVNSEDQINDVKDELQMGFTKSPTILKEVTVEGRISLCIRSEKGEIDPLGVLEIQEPKCKKA